MTADVRARAATLAGLWRRGDRAKAIAAHANFLDEFDDPVTEYPVLFAAIVDVLGQAAASEFLDAALVSNYREMCAVDLDTLSDVERDRHIANLTTAEQGLIVRGIRPPTRAVS